LGRHRDDFVFPDGTLHIRHQEISQHQKFDADTCVGRFWEKGTYAVTGGTGAYENVSGSGRYTVTGVIQGCDRHQPPTSFSVVIQAQGPLTLG